MTARTPVAPRVRARDRRGGHPVRRERTDESGHQRLFTCSSSIPQPGSRTLRLVSSVLDRRAQPDGRDDPARATAAGPSCSACRPDARAAPASVLDPLARRPGRARRLRAARVRRARSTATSGSSSTAGSTSRAASRRTSASSTRSARSPTRCPAWRSGWATSSALDPVLSARLFFTGALGAVLRAAVRAGPRHLRLARRPGSSPRRCS